MRWIVWAMNALCILAIITVGLLLTDLYWLN
jgi:hypothetical protein